MRILLVKVPQVSDAVQPLLGLGYLAAVVPREHPLDVVDGVHQPFTDQDLARRLERERTDLIGFQCLSGEVDTVRRLAAVARRARPEIRVVVGGAFPSGAAGGGLDELGADVDFTFRGEAEPGFAALVDLLAAVPAPSPEQLAGIPGLVYRVANRLQENAPTRPDLAELPLPRWDLLRPETYPPSPNAAFFRRWPAAPILTSRGCPHDCAFCAAATVHGRRVRYRPLGRVLEEIALLRERGIAEIHLADDNFTADPKYVRAFCAGLRRHFPGLPWACPNGVRLKSLTPDLLAEMRRAGCHSVGLGLESGSQRQLDRMGKRLKVEDMRQRVHWIHEAGIAAAGFFILGLPDETRAEMEATIRLATELPLRRANFMLFSPFPGSRFWEELQAGDRGAAPPSFAEVGYVPTGLTSAELKALQRQAFLRFYLRPRAAASLLRDVRSVEHGYWILRRMLRWLAPGGRA